MKKAVFVLVALVALPAFAQRDEVLVLGTYHMANPGHDIFNMKADDVTAPKRQAEIAQLMTVAPRQGNGADEDLRRLRRAGEGAGRCVCGSSRTDR